MSKLKTSNKMINNVIKHIEQYSIVSGKTYYNEKIFYLQQTKKYIYERFMEKTPNVKLSLTTFYRIVPKHFQVPLRQSDKCPICHYGKKQLNENELIDKQAYLRHDKFKEKQNKHYKLKKDGLKDKECIIVMDLIQNFVLDKGPKETNHDFYNKEHVSCLGFYVLYKKDNKPQLEYYNYLYSILKHDSLYVSNCISILIEKYLKNRFEMIMLVTLDALNYITIF